MGMEIRQGSSLDAVETLTLHGGGGQPEGGEAYSQGSALVVFMRTFVTNKLAVVGLGIVILMFIFCFLGPVIYRTNQVAVNILNINESPAWPTHPLGTDFTGFDELGRLMVGGQTALIIGMAAAAIATVVGVIWGAIAGFFGGFVDTVMMRIVDTLLSVPQLFLLLLIAALVPISVGILIFVVALVAWLVPARLVRGEVLSLKTREYVDAVRVMGGSSWRVIFRHLIPNCVGTIMVNATFQVADAILSLAALSYLGLGVPPPAANWGGMLSDGSNYLFDGYWWAIYPPGVAIVLTVVAFNFIGDALRDSFEVRLQEQ